MHATPKQLPIFKFELKEVNRFHACNNSMRQIMPSFGKFFGLIEHVDCPYSIWLQVEMIERLPKILQLSAERGRSLFPAVSKVNLVVRDLNPSIHLRFKESPIDLNKSNRRTKSTELVVLKMNIKSAIFFLGAIKRHVSRHPERLRVQFMPYWAKRFPRLSNVLHQINSVAPIFRSPLWPRPIGVAR